MPVNYDGPDESVECAYPGCSNKLRRSDFNEPQFCSKEHRDAAAAPLAATLQRVRGKCWSCGLWVWLRKDGNLGSHRVRGGNRSVCEGTGQTPGESGLG